MPRVPTASDFPQSLVVSIVPPPDSKPPLNVLILLHGLGDTNVPFTGLGAQLHLAETVCLSVQAPHPLPFDLGGFYWGDDIVFDQSNGKMDFDTGFDKATDLLADSVVRQALLDKCGFKSRDVLIFGFGQGAMAAVATARSMEDELGGVISIGGPLPEKSRVLSHQTKSKTPLLALGGSSQSLITTSAVRALKDAFAQVQTVTWSRPGDGMPNSRDEMLPIMQFFARRLRSKAGVPDGAAEIG